MIGKIVGFIVGTAIAVTGYGMLKPALFVKYYDFGKLTLGPFAEYKTLVCWLIVAVGGRTPQAHGAGDLRPGRA